MPLKALLLIKLSATNVETITIATLMKLLAIKIVAKSFLGVESKSRIRLLLVDSSSSRLILSDAVMEKKATSEPDISAERIISNNMIAKPIPNGIEKDWKIFKKIFSVAKNGISKL